MKPIKIVCCDCGGDEINADATVYWNTETQAWEAANVSEVFCGDCDSQVKAEWVDI